MARMRHRAMHEGLLSLFPLFCQSLGACFLCIVLCCSVAATLSKDSLQMQWEAASHFLFDSSLPLLSFTRITLRLYDRILQL